MTSLSNIQLAGELGYLKACEATPYARMNITRMHRKNIRSVSCQNANRNKGIASTAMTPFLSRTYTRGVKAIVLSWSTPKNAPWSASLSSYSCKHLFCQRKGWSSCLLRKPFLFLIFTKSSSKSFPEKGKESFLEIANKTSVLALIHRPCWNPALVKHSSHKKWPCWVHFLNCNIHNVRPHSTLYE